MLDFTYNQSPGRVIFGVGALDKLAEEVDALGCTRALVLTTPEQEAMGADVAKRLGKRSVGLFAKAVMHVPAELAQEARAEAKRLEADCTVTIGGGSTTGLGKIIALETGLPVLAIPTTYAGSEMTPIWGLTEGGLKKTGRDARVLPKTVIYDPALTISMPAALSGASGINAIAHCVEALYAHDANPITSLMAEDGIRALGRSLPVVVKEPKNLEARSEALYGAYMAGSTLGSVGVALHHKLCHALGGSFNLGHAEVHSVILPYAVAYNAPAAPEAMARVARALGVEDASSGLHDLCLAVGAPTALKDIGMKEKDLDRGAEIAMSAPYPNPRPLEHAAIRELLQRAYNGNRPTP